MTLCKTQQYTDPGAPTYGPNDDRESRLIIAMQSFVTRSRRKSRKATKEASLVNGAEQIYDLAALEKLIRLFTRLRSARKGKSCLGLHIGQRAESSLHVNSPADGQGVQGSGWRVQD